MARVVKTLPSKGGNKKYPWPEWLDGRVWELTAGEDFQVDIQLMRTQANVTAARLGKRAKTRVVGDTLYIQGVPQ